MLKVEKKILEGSIVGIASKNVDFEKKNESINVVYI